MQTVSIIEDTRLLLHTIQSQFQFLFLKKKLLSQLWKLPELNNLSRQIIRQIYL